MSWEDPIYKGATRPAMMFGVPFVPLVIAVGFLLWLSAVTTMVVALAIPPVVLTMGTVTRADDQQYRLLALQWMFRFRMRTTRYWQSVTFSPSRFRGPR